MLNHALKRRLLIYLALMCLSFCSVVVSAIGFPHPSVANSPVTTHVATTSVATTPIPATLSNGRKLYEAGQFVEAIATLRQVAQAYADQGDRLNQSLSLSYLSLAYQQLNQWDNARTAIDTSITLLKALPQVDSRLWAQVLNTQATLLLHTGQTQAALETWQQAESYYQQANDGSGMLGSRLNQVQALQTLGYYRRSRQLLDSISAQLAKTNDSVLKLDSLHSLGNVLRSTGDLAASRQVLDQSLTLARKINATQDFSAILLSLGNTLADGIADRSRIDNPETNTALQYFVQAEQAATNPNDRLQAQLNQLHLYVEQNQTPKISALASQIQQQLNRLPASRSSLYGTINFTNTLARLEQPPLSAATVAQLLMTTIKSSRNLNDSFAESYALAQLGQLYIRQGQGTEGIRLLDQSLEIAQSIQANEIVSQSAWSLGRALNRQGQPQPAIVAYTQAVNALKALRGDLVDINQDIQFSFRESVEPVYRELVGLLLSNNPDQAALIQVRELIEALQLAELDNFFREACTDVQTQQIDQIDPNATVVYSILLPDQLAVVLSTAGQPLQYYTTPMAQATVEQTLQQFLSALHPVSDNAERLRLSQQIYDWLIRPAEKINAFQGKQTLVFVLDSTLRQIPIAALHDGQQYLIEKYAVALSPGLKLVSTKGLSQQKIHAVVGGISEAHLGFQALPKVEAEVREISQSLTATKLLNQGFTRSNLANQLKGGAVNVVHLATHGQFSSNQADTFLLVWDGRLNIQELSELLQQRTIGRSDTLELLVLSACNTATGDDRAILGLAGLAVKSGARSTMATLWPVQDKVAAQLMVRFYQELRQPNSTKAQALRQAQLSLLQDEGFSDPFFWAAFVIVGNWL